MTRIEEIESRKAEIRELMNAEDADINLDELTEEVRALNAEAENIRQTAAKAEELRTLVAQGEGVIVETIEKVEERKNEMTFEEMRASKEYLNAFANYIKTGRDDELRSSPFAPLMTENATGGTVPVPTFVEDVIRTAWERDGITSLVRKTYLRGNVKVGFEISGTDAAVHTEGADKPDAEELVIGVANLTPVSIKKWLTITDESVDIGGGNSEAFVRYIYDELTYRIAAKAAEGIITIIATNDGVGDSNTPAQTINKEALSLTTVANAIAGLCDAASNPVIVMNKGTWAAIKALQYGAGYAVDPFEGLNVVFNSTLPAYADASEDDAYMIVGDFGVGVQANFPNGEEVTIKYDDISLAEYDLVKITGRMFIGFGLVCPHAFTVVTAPEAE